MDDPPEDDFDGLAVLAHSFFLSLVKAGFSEFQALRFVALFFSARDAFKDGMEST